MTPNRTLIISLFFLLLTQWSVRAADRESSTTQTDLPAIEWRSYTIRLLIGLDQSQFNEQDCQQVISETQNAIERYVGDPWTLSIAKVDWLSPVSSESLSRVTSPDLKQHDPDQQPDVWFVVAVESRPSGLRVSLRSWQPDVKQQTVVSSIDVVDHREISTSIVSLCRNLFRPMGVVEQVEEKVVRFRLQAGEIRPFDSSFTQLSKGDLLLPLFAYRDKNRNIERLQAVPWTYVEVDAIDSSTVMGTVQSGLRTSINVKRRGRIDTLLVVARPQFLQTDIELVTQSKLPQILAAHRIEVRSQPIIPRPSKAEPDLDPASTLLSEILTDRRGITHVPLIPGHSLVWLFVYSGDQQLARVPLVPGLERTVRLEVPDDATRLMAEADLQMLQGEVIDAVALRNTAFATIRSASKRDDWKTVNQKLALLKGRQDSTSLLDRLNAVRVLGVAAAKSRKDKAAEVRINRICDDATLLIKVHLNDDKVRLLTEEMEALQSTDSAKTK